ncbi:MAG: ABC transporter ATP-binding protein [Acidobacteriota bacterium]
MSEKGGLTVVGAHVAFGSRPGLVGVDLTVRRGERVALLGPSGVGKTSLLRAIAGLGGLVAGAVGVDGRDVTSDPPERRGIVYMHQAPSLFAHLTVLDNVGFPLEVRGASRRQARARAGALLERVQLGPQATRAPGTLSGGQRHRVALARALAADPAVLLLDEPFSSLDPELRADVRQSVVDLLDDHVDASPAVVVVTHDVDEAAGLAHQLIVLLEGRVAQIASPADLLTTPASIAVARFLGLPNVLPGTRKDGTTVVCALGHVRAPGVPGQVTVVVRTNALRLRPRRGGDVTGTVVRILDRVSGSTIQVDVDGHRLLGVPEHGFSAAAGDVVDISVEGTALHVIDVAAEQRRDA